MKIGKHRWTPDTIEKALRLAVDVPSIRRAAEHFQAVSRIAISKSTLHELVGEYGCRLVQKEATEAEQLHTGADTLRSPLPDAETMAVSMDGVMVHVRDEGWKEVKVAAFSAVDKGKGQGAEESQVQLGRHSYCAGLWDAAIFAKQQWAEGWRRGLERARQVVAISDGASWIWGIVLLCYAPCIEIIDWWHALQKVWGIAWAVYGTGTEEAARWVETLKAHLWAGDLCSLYRELRGCWPRGKPLSDELRQAVGYLWRHRRRMRYQAYRKAGYPIGSGTVESACKVVVQERICQAGMRWSRPRLQAMLVLRCALLSNRWDITWAELAPKVT